MGWYEKIKHSIRYWLLRKLPPCREAVVIISESMERPLTLRERVVLMPHLWVCSWCQWYMEHLKTIRETLRRQPSQSSEGNLANTPGLSDDARERLKRNLANRT
jgi:hypothetical protein